MPNQALSGIENNFTKGLVTEFTGLNFPENAATDCDNVTFTLVGDVIRRLGIDYEANHGTNLIDRTNRAINSYRWRNAGGDGVSEVLAVQSGNIISFFSITNATPASPISANIIPGTVNLSDFLPVGGTMDLSVEADFADGNGYLFIYHANCEPLYCTLTATAGVVASPITVQVRDFNGIPEPGVAVNIRSTSITRSHSYNLANQGWTTGAAWAASAPTGVAITLGSNVFNIGTVAGITLGDQVILRSQAIYYYPGGPVQYPDGYVSASGTVTSYVNPNVTINISSMVNPVPGSVFGFYINQTNQGFVDAWHTSQGNYPSNADVWWYFKDNTGTFAPATQSNKTLNSGNAPQGHFTMTAFNLDRSTASGIASLTSVHTTARPSTGCWFQGRVWYTGVSASQQSEAEEPFYSWSENIYFSQINVGTATNFGNCFQTNDPTSENLFDILPTDGGVIQIQGSGRVYKLFPIQNGMLVFAANGVWFITGSQGIGFAANDYTITRLSNITTLSTSSFVNVLGLPFFWNEDGIYAVEQTQGGGLAVNSMTYTTIDTFYDTIPIQNKRYVRGAYDPINYTIQWVYRSTASTTVTERYQYDSLLNYNTANKAFFPFSISADLNASINSIVYIQDQGENSISSGFRYVASNLSGVTFNITIADERDTNYVDWASAVAVNYDSFFVTGYKLHGQGQRRFQMPYIYMFSRAEEATGYKIQSLWDYATSGNSGKWSSIQQIYNNKPYFGMIFRRHRLRGQGIVLQIKVSSVDGTPFDIMGWSTFETQNTGV